MIAQWYFILGILTIVIGIYRGITNRQSTEPDELTVFSWFILWWIWLPIFLIKYLKKHLKNLKRNKV